MQDFFGTSASKVQLAIAHYSTATTKINKTFIVNLLCSCPPLFTDVVPAGPLGLATQLHGLSLDS
jgi:hypothetical protein